MSYRKTVFATNEIYHVYNRGVEKRPIFMIRKDYLRFLELINYYRFLSCPVKYSHFKQLSTEERNYILKDLESNSKRLVEVSTFSLMPNHVHLLIKQLAENGISKFMSKVTNGYSHYFNIRHERVGHLFQGNFGAVRIEDDEQHLHVHRYIHLNPVTSHIINFNALEDYEYSSYPEYLGLNNGFCGGKEEILSQFKNIDSYKKFIEDQVDYARKLDSIKHLVIE